MYTKSKMVIKMEKKFDLNNLYYGVRKRLINKNGEYDFVDINNPVIFAYYSYSDMKMIRNLLYSKLVKIKYYKEALSDTEYSGVYEALIHPDANDVYFDCFGLVMDYIPREVKIKGYLTEKELLDTLEYFKKEYNSYKVKKDSNYRMNTSNKNMIKYVDDLIDLAKTNPDRAKELALKALYETGVIDENGMLKK